MIGPRTAGAGKNDGDSACTESQTDLYQRYHPNVMPHASSLGHLHAGFVAMEYFALILNRSYVVFITDEGLRSWKLCGLVNTRHPTFYEPIEALLDDPEMAPGSAAYIDVMHQRGTFLIPYSTVRFVVFVGKLKWGMGPIPHAGRLLIGLDTGRKREFILLGHAYGHGIQNLISAHAGLALRTE